MFKKKTEEKKQQEKPAEFVPRFVTEDEYKYALYILENAVASGQVFSKEERIVLPTLAIVENVYIRNPSITSDTYLMTPIGYSAYLRGAQAIRSCQFRTEKDIKEEKRVILESQVKAKREAIDKEVAELEKLSKELGNLK